MVGRRLLPLPYPKLVVRHKVTGNLYLFKHPIKLLKALLKEENTPLGLSLSAGIGVFLGVLPLVSMHTVAIIYVTTRLHLNKVMALSIQTLCMPPIVPIACIQLGHFILYKKWITEVSWHTVFGSIPQRIWEWFLGSLILAPLMSLIIGVFVYVLAKNIEKNK